MQFSHCKCIKRLSLICFAIRMDQCPNYVFWGYFLANTFRNHMNCLKLSGHITHEFTTGSTWKRSISQVFLSLNRVDMTWCECLVSFFLQMKEIPVETIMTVQKLSENKTQSLCSTEHKKWSILQVFYYWKGYRQPTKCVGEIFSSKGRNAYRSYNQDKNNQETRIKV